MRSLASAKSLSLILGQAVWALSQAFIVLLLASRGEIALVGLVTLGLAIHAPLVTLGNFNLRQLVALDDLRRITPRHAFATRGAVAVASVLITGAVLSRVAPPGADWLAAWLIVASRVADNLAEVALGFYQRDQHTARAGRSYLLRGLAVMLPFGLALGLGAPVWLAALVTAASAIGIVLAVDVRGCSTGAPAGSFTAFRGRLRAMIWASPSPMLDSLHFASLRYAVYIFTSVEVLGMVGLALTLFVPLQLLSMTYFFGFFTRTRDAVRAGDNTGLRRAVLHGLGFGAGLSLCYLAAAALIPDLLLQLAVPEIADHLRPVLLAIGIAVVFQLASFLLASVHLTRGDALEQSINPLIGLFLFWVAVLGLSLGADGPLPLWVIAVAYAASSALRVAFALVRCLRPLPAPLPETQPR